MGNEQLLIKKKCLLFVTGYKVKISVIGLIFSLIQFVNTFIIFINELYVVLFHRNVIIIHVSVMIIVNGICNTIIISMLFLQIKKFESLLNDVLKLLSNISSNSICKTSLISHTVTFFCVSYIFVAISCCYAIGMFTIRTILFQWMYFSAFTTDSLIITLSTILSKNYEEINNSIEKIYKEKSTNIKSISVLINNIILKHWYIGDIVLKISTCFGPHLLLSNISILFTVTMGLSKTYYIYMLPNINWNSNFLTVSTVFDCILLLLRVVLISKRCNSVTYQVCIYNYY